MRRWLAVATLLLAACGVTTPEKPALPRIGAICVDGSVSYATGQGACSWHSGVDYWIHSNCTLLEMRMDQLGIAPTTSECQAYKEES